jgi:hypothetical protein
LPAKAATAVDVLVIAALRLNSLEIEGVTQETLLWWARDAGLKISMRTFRTTLREAECSGLVVTYPVYGLDDDGEIKQKPNGYQLSSEVDLSGVRFIQVSEGTYTIAVSPDYPEPDGRMPLPAGWARIDPARTAGEVHRQVMNSLAGTDLPF